MKKNISRVSRISDLIQYLNTSVNKFEQDIGVTQSRIAKAIKRNSDISADIVQKISDRFPNISPNWLLKGEGEMILDKMKKNISRDRLNIAVASLRKTHIKIAEEMGYSRPQTISDNLKGNATQKFILHLCNLYGFNPEWILKGEGEMILDESEERLENKDILKRIGQVANNEEITITSLESKIGASKGVFSRALAKNTDIQSKWLILIANKYPQYSCKWLLTGDGEMLAGNPISQSDIKTIELLISLLVDAHGYSEDFVPIKKARELISRL